jgi:cytochrome P450
MSKVREEVAAVAAKHSKDPKASLVDQLSSLPIEVWETGFPNIDLCLRDSIRLQLVGTAMRKNVSGHDVKVGDAIIPHGAYVMYPIADVHHDPDVYQDPEKWDPSRYLPGRAEDKKKPYAYCGWGLGRHPCCKFTLNLPQELSKEYYFLTAFSGYAICQTRKQRYHRFLARYVRL